MCVCVRACVHVVDDVVAEGITKLIIMDEHLAGTRNSRAAGRKSKVMGPRVGPRAPQERELRHGLRISPGHAHRMLGGHCWTHQETWQQRRRWPTLVQACKTGDLW